VSQLHPNPCTDLSTYALFMGSGWDQWVQVQQYEHCTPEDWRKLLLGEWRHCVGQVCYG
jgi:hypothetical protein